MQRIWNYVSNLGTTGDNIQTDQRTIVLTNQINLVMFFTMLLLLPYTYFTLQATNEAMYIGTLRVALLLIVNFLNLVFARFGYTRLSKLSIIYAPAVVFLLLPTIIGYVEEESYTYYPYIVIGTSIIPQLLLHPQKEKFHYWFSLCYYLAMVIYIDKIMILFDPNHFLIVDRINTFYDFYKIAHVALFLFINASIYYLRSLNFRYEEELNLKNRELDLQNIELRAQKDEIEKQKDEIVSKEISTWQKLVNIISHEIVNSAIPITNLAGMTAQMLEDESGIVQKPEKIGEDVTEDIHHSLRIIESRTQGLINFVKATKSLTDIPKPNLRKIFLSDLFERVFILYKAKFNETGVKFEKEVIPPDLAIEADLELIEQVIINLFQNALDAMTETADRRLSIIGESESDHVQISISDNGKGISNDVIEKIFLPYYSTKTNNSGIGLSLSQQIMMTHHARLEVNSTLGKGTTFIMIF
jgi:signal transduction histidine kinase